MTDNIVQRMAQLGMAAITLSAKMERITRSFHE